MERYSITVPLVLILFGGITAFPQINIWWNGVSRVPLDYTTYRGLMTSQLHHLARHKSLLHRVTP